ncbi:MAG: flagellin, partial [Candidatus Riflebacteria bacterium]
MSLRINQNVLAMGTYKSVAQTSSRLEKSIQKLSSGLRINSAADDAAGLAISEKMRRQIRGLSRAVLNAQDGISMLQTAEGALNETHSILQRMRELAIQSSNDTLTSNDRVEIQKEIVQLKDDLNRIARNTEFNTKKLLDGSQTALISASSNAVRGMVTGPISGGGGDYNISIALLKGGIAQMQSSQIFTIHDNQGNLADGGTQLQSIAQFYDANGVFVLDTPQKLIINGNSRTTEINLDGQMSLDNLAAEIQNALVSDSGLGIENSRVAIVNTVQTRIAGLGGYLELTSGYIGDNGQFSFSGDQKLVDALGLSVSRSGENNRVELSLKDGFGNVRTTKTEDGRAVGLLDGIDIDFKSQAAQIAGTSGLQAGLNISAAETFQIAAGSVVATVTIAAGYWTMEGLSRSLNAQVNSATAQFIKGLSAVVVEGEIRLAYDKPSTSSITIGTTITINSSSNSVLGFLNGTYSGFVDGAKDGSKITWGYSSYVVSSTTNIQAGTSIQISASDGVNTVVITLMTTLGTGQETTADMVSFINFQANANQAFQTASVAIRVDQVGGAMAFTSTRVGTQHNDNSPAFTSMVSLTMSATQSIFAFSNFGLKEGTVKGFGDMNFRMHVVDNQPQFQIGADQGQKMEISIGNMCATCLEVNDIDLTTTQGSSAAIGKLNKALDKVSAERSKLGAFQNRLEYAINNLRNTHSNLSASESRIRDADIAMEMIEFTRNQILSQSGTAMLAQANTVPQGV